jgi:hypothetical protein
VFALATDFIVATVDHPSRPLQLLPAAGACRQKVEKQPLQGSRRLPAFDKALFDRAFDTSGKSGAFFQYSEIVYPFARTNPEADLCQ